VKSAPFSFDNQIEDMANKILKLQALATLPVSQRAHLKGGDPFVRTFSKTIDSLPRQPLNLATDRREHVLRVISNFHALVSGRYKLLYSILNEKDRSTTDFKVYQAALMKVRNAFDLLTIDEQKEAHLAIVLHDIGYLRKPGWEHTEEGGRMAPQMIRDAGIMIDADKVGTIIGNHALTNNFGVDVFPDRFLSIPKKVHRQIFILDCMDCTSKGAELKSSLSVRLINEMQEVLTREDLIRDPEWFYEYRLRHLLGPNTFIYLSDPQLGLLKYHIKKSVSSQGQTMLKKVLVNHLQDGAFPVFQELLLKHEGTQETVLLIYAICEKIAGLNLPRGGRVFFKTEPDIFSLPMGGPERERAIKSLKVDLINAKFDADKALTLKDNRTELILHLKV